MRNKVCSVGIFLFSLIWIGVLSAQEARTADVDRTEMPSIPPQEQWDNQGRPETMPLSSDAENLQGFGEMQAAPLDSTPGRISISDAAARNNISLEIKGMDVVDVLKMLASRSGFNIVVGKNVTGRVTLFLKEVDIWDAFELILASNDLAYDKKGKIINVMTQRDYELIYGERYQDKKQARVIQLKYAKAADLSRALVQLKTNVGRVVVDEGSNTVVLIDAPETLGKMEEFIKTADQPVQTRVFGLDYALAEKISAKLQESITKGVGSIKVDERTNKLVVTDYPLKLDEIAKVVAAFDEKTPQVLIDAQIVQVSPSDQFQMGVDWDFWIKKYFEVRASLPISAANALFVGTPSSSKVLGPGESKEILSILRTIGDVKVLSSPRVMVLNNQEAKIHVGTRDAYITSTTSQSGTAPNVTAQSVNFVDTGIQLAVTPTINRDGFVTMKIKPEISDSTRTDITSEGVITQVPIVTTSEAETTVMVKDGVTIIIGGLRKDKREKTVKKIPVLGDIPLLGFAFRSTEDNVTKTELVILLTPHLMSGESSYTDVTQVTPKEGAIAKMKNGQILTQAYSQSTQDAALGVEINTGYSKIVFDKVKSVALSEKPKGEKGEVRVSFLVSREGKLLGDPNVFFTTSPSLTPFAVKAIKDAAPFPEFDKTINKTQETFRIILNYE